MSPWLASILFLVEGFYIFFTNGCVPVFQRDFIIIIIIAAVVDYCSDMNPASWIKRAGENPSNLCNNNTRRETGKGRRGSWPLVRWCTPQYEDICAFCNRGGEEPMWPRWASACVRIKCVRVHLISCFHSGFCLISRRSTDVTSRCGINSGGRFYLTCRAPVRSDDDDGTPPID